MELLRKKRFTLKAEAMQEVFIYIEIFYNRQRIRRVREMLDAIGSQAELEVDGGVNTKMIREVRNAGASIVATGSSVFLPKPAWHKAWRY